MTVAQKSSVYHLDCGEEIHIGTFDSRNDAVAFVRKNAIYPAPIQSELYQDEQRVGRFTESGLIVYAGFVYGLDTSEGGYNG